MAEHTADEEAAAINILVSCDGGKTSETRSCAPVWAQGGLAVTPAAHANATWTITHSPSGYALWSDVPAQAQACALAEQLLELGDWTRPQPEVSHDTDLKRRFHELRATWTEGNLPPLITRHSPIRALGLAPKLASQLGRSQIATVAQLVDLSVSEVESLRNVGPKYRQDIEAALARVGLALHPERPPLAAPRPDGTITLALTRAQAKELLHVLEFVDNALSLALEEEAT